MSRTFTSHFPGRAGHSVPAAAPSVVIPPVSVAVRLESVPKPLQCAAPARIFGAGIVEAEFFSGRKGLR